MKTEPVDYIKVKIETQAKCNVENPQENVNNCLKPTNNKKTYYICPFCKAMKTFTSKTDLTDHVSEFHQGQNILFCLICEACFSCKFTLSDHMKRYHNKISKLIF